MDLAVGEAQVLGLLLHAAIPHAEVDIAILKNHTRAKVVTTIRIELCISRIDGLLLYPLESVQLAADYLGHGTTSSRFRVSQIYPPALQVRVALYLQQAALTFVKDLRNAGN